MKQPKLSEEAFDAALADVKEMQDQGILDALAPDSSSTTADEEPEETEEPERHSRRRRRRRYRRPFQPIINVTIPAAPNVLKQTIVERDGNGLITRTTTKDVPEDGLDS